jgi:ribosomal protein S18 acetylase RimI-like enzyme
MAEIRYDSDLIGIDWALVKEILAADDWDNGRSPEQYRRSFENSYAVVFARDGSEIVGMVRALSDEVCNAYIVDVWTHSRLRRQGIATRMMEILLEKLPGQHVYLFTDEYIDFYAKLGFRPWETGMGMVVGTWLENKPG